MDEEEKRPLFSVNGNSSSEEEAHSQTYSTHSDSPPHGIHSVHQPRLRQQQPRSHGHGHGQGDEEHWDDGIEFCAAGITGKEGNRKASNMARITLMGLLMLLYSLGEIIFSLKAKSLTMFSDGLHNLSDAFALAIALWAERVQTQTSQEWMTFGWKRAETIGGFVNAGFVLSMAVFVLLQAIPDFIYPDPDKIKQEEAMPITIIAAVGIFLNIVGMVAFCGHGHAHGHSHGGGGGHSHGHGDSHGGGDDDHGHSHETKRDHNIWALFLHFLGDVLTSILVLAVGLLAYYFPSDEHKWVAYLDPGAASLSCLIITATAWPVVTSTTRIFLQFSPPDLDITGIKEKIQRVETVLEIHEAHFWQLVDGLVICTMHLKLVGSADWNNIRQRIIDILHSYGIHNTTLQPEFVDAQQGQPLTVGLCQEEGTCVPNCSADRCCT